MLSSTQATLSGTDGENVHARSDSAKPTIFVCVPSSFRYSQFVLGQSSLRIFAFSNTPFSIALPWNRRFIYEKRALSSLARTHSNNLTAQCTDPTRISCFPLWPRTLRMRYIFWQLPTDAYQFSFHTKFSIYIGRWCAGAVDFLVFPFSLHAF